MISAGDLQGRSKAKSTTDLETHRWSKADLYQLKPSTPQNLLEQGVSEPPWGGTGRQEGGCPPVTPPDPSFCLFSTRFPRCPPPSSPWLRAPGGLPRALRARQHGHQHPRHSLRHPVDHTDPGLFILFPQQQNFRGRSEVRQEGAAATQPPASQFQPWHTGSLLCKTRSSALEEDYEDK